MDVTKLGFSPDPFPSLHNFGVMFWEQIAFLCGVLIPLSAFCDLSDLLCLEMWPDLRREGWVKTPPDKARPVAPSIVSLLLAFRPAQGVGTCVHSRLRTI